jgi:hypothetical protein
VTLPEQLLLSDLLRRRVRCDQGLDHGPGLQGWMHPPVHRLLGWSSKPSAFGSRRLVWRLNQLRGFSEQEALVLGEPAETDPATLERLPTLFDAALLGSDNGVLGVIADANVDLRSGRILDYLVSRSDPRLPGSSRWLLSPERIVDQQPGQVMTALAAARRPAPGPGQRAPGIPAPLPPLAGTGGAGEFPLAGSLPAGGRAASRSSLEGWLEEPPWEPGPAGRNHGKGRVDAPAPDPTWSEPLTRTGTNSDGRGDALARRSIPGRPSFRPRPPPGPGSAEPLDPLEDPWV